jgi:uncharacterized pyridoxal phosphate-containing UPF0001 family protein
MGSNIAIIEYHLVGNIDENKRSQIVQEIAHIKFAKMTWLWLEGNKI